MDFRAKRFIPVLVGSLVLVVAAIVPVWSYLQLQKPVLTDKPLLFEVPGGANAASLAADLDNLGVLPVPRWLFRYYGALTADRGTIKAGEYELVSGMTVPDVYGLFRSGRVVQRVITFPEGWRFEEWRTILLKTDGIRHELPGMTDYQIMSALGEPGISPEGRFFPDTYHFTRGEKDLEILRRAFERMQKILASEWQSRTVGSVLKSPDEALILASIVEKETGYAPDRGNIARVFINRLHNHIRLQSDPTVIYGLGSSFAGDLKRRHLRESTPWNTYVIERLPPTPICMPGLASIRAVLHPPPGDFLYFVARGDGRSHFSSTLKAHNEAVLRFQRNRAADRSGSYRSSPPE